MGVAGSKPTPGSRGKPRRWHASIPSRFEAGREIQQRILNEAEHLGYNGHCIFAIKLALEEALINAIKHGNKLDPKKQVHVDVLITPKQAEIGIEDEGPGFDRSSVPDPLAEENLEKCSGRGILLIESYMNEVQWTNRGRRLRMLKRNEPDTLPRN